MSDKRDPKQSVAKIIDELVRRAEERKARERKRRFIDPDDVEIWPS